MAGQHSDIDHNGLTGVGVATATFNDHSARHENGGGDEISIAGLDGTPTELTNHLGDAVDAHDASAVSVDPTGLAHTAATEVQTVLEDYDAAITTAAGGGTPSGTSFPGGPSTDDQFFRTDLGMEFYYNGSIWLSKGLQQTQLIQTDAAIPFSVTGGVLRAVTPVWGGSDIYLVAAQCWFSVGSGASALSASHKWVGVLNKVPAATTIATFTIDSGANSTHRKTTLAAIGSALGSTNFEFEVAWTKTGTPGVLYCQAVISWRYIAV